jgi:hypothetical protein
VHVPSIQDDVKPLDLSISSSKPTSEQPLNLTSKRKRHTPVSLSSAKRQHPSPSTSTAATAAAAAASSSMFIPFYAISPFFDSNAGNQQEIFQQFQAFYLQLQQQQQQQQKLTTGTSVKNE